MPSDKIVEAHLAATKTPNEMLNLAAMYLNLKGVKAALKKGAEVNSTKDGVSALHWVSRTVENRNTLAIARILLENHANPNTQNTEGATPLHHAAEFGLLNTVELLLQYKADTTIKDKQGDTPLSVLLRLNNIGQIVQKLQVAVLKTDALKGQLRTSASKTKVKQ